MKVGDIVFLETYCRSPRKGIITKVGIPSGMGDNLTTYEVEVQDFPFPLKFYMKPELRSGKHFNVGNRAYWIRKAVVV